MDFISGLVFHPKGNLLGTCSGDGTIKIWDFVNANCNFTFNEHGLAVWKMDFHYDGNFMISCSMDHTIKLFDLNYGNFRSKYTFRGHVDSVNSC